LKEYLYELPFDQFQRYKGVEEAIGLVRESRPLKILDVGGYPGLISDFLPEDETYILDVIPHNRSNYIQANGTSLPFKESSFDVVTAIDTLEHIPEEKRKQFVSELFRISSQWIIIMGPFFSEEIHLAERIILEFSLKTLGKDFAESHPLKEHLLYGLPHISQLKQEIEELEGKFLVFPSGYLYHWMILNFVKHFLFTVPNSDELHKMVDKYYNIYFYEEDKRDPSYRHMLVIVKNRQSKLLDRLNKKFTQNNPASIEDLSHKLQLFGLLFSLFDQGARRELEEIKQKNRHLEEMLYGRESQIEELEAKIEEIRREKELSRHIVAEQLSQLESLKKVIAEKEVYLRDLENLVRKIKRTPTYKLYSLIKDFERTRG